MFVGVVVVTVGVLVGLVVRRTEQRRSQLHYANGLAYIELATAARAPDVGAHLVVAFDPRFTAMRDQTLAAHRDGGPA